MMMTPELLASIREVCLNPAPCALPQFPFAFDFTQVRPRGRRISSGAVNWPIQSFGSRLGARITEHSTYSTGCSIPMRMNDVELFPISFITFSDFFMSELVHSLKIAPLNADAQAQLALDSKLDHGRQAPPQHLGLSLQEEYIVNPRPGKATN